MIHIETVNFSYKYFVTLCDEYCKETAAYKETTKRLVIEISSEEYSPTYFLYFLSSYLFETIYLYYTRDTIYSLSSHNIITPSIEKIYICIGFKKFF